MKLNFEKGAPPLYMQLESLLKEKIEQGEYNKGDMFPTEKELMENYHVSRITVRQAVAQLAQMGYVKGQRGVGTEVVYEKIEEKIHRVISFTEEMKKHNITMETSFCEMKKVYPDKIVAKQLELPLTEQCYCLRRVRNVEQKPLVYTITYLKLLKEIQALPLDSRYYTDSLYCYLKDEYGIMIHSGEDVLEAAVASEQVREYLQIAKNMPVFIRTRKTFLADGTIFEYSKCYYPGNRYKYKIEL